MSQLLSNESPIGATVLNSDREEFSKSLSKFLLVFGKKLEPSQEDVWFSLLKRFELETVRKGMMAYTRTGKRPPVPANLVELCSPSEDSDTRKIADVIASLPFKFNKGAEVFCRRMIQDHGKLAAAEMWEQSYPGHGRKYIEELDRTFTELSQ